MTVAQAAENAATGAWEVPEFQRAFVWKPEQVCELADSLWRDYPVGSILLWREAGARGRSARSVTWIVDGQQRATSLCLLFGYWPHWWNQRPGRDAILREHPVLFDVEAVEPPFFVLAGSKSSGPRFISVARLLALDLFKLEGRVELRKLAETVKALGLCHSMDIQSVQQRLFRVCSIRNRALSATVVSHELGDVLEVFERLNTRGMKFRRLLLKLMLQAIPGARNWY